MELIEDGKATVVTPLAAALDAVDVAALARVSDADLLAELRAFEAVRRRMAVFDHALITQLESRGVAGALAMRSTAALLQGVLRVSPRAAKQRVVAAASCGPRVSLTGEGLGPVLPALAAAQAAGMVSEEHTNVIIKSLEKLPPGLVEVHDAAERTLVQLAGQARPQEVARAGAYYLAHYDPDGVLADEREQDRRRGVTLTALDGGLWRLTGTLTGTCGAQLAAVLGARSAPRPADKDGLDPRSHVQRTHDALDELAGIVVRRKELSKSGAPATVIITMTEDQYLARKGLVETSSGQLLTVQSALELADEAILVGLVQAANGAVLKLGLSQRIATRRQTWALAARDKGCSIPDCDEPPERCQRHHVIPWCLGGPTDISNLTLLCRYHHRMFGKLGWRCLMLDGLPHWIKPPWQDPTQAPLLHHRIRPGV